MNINKTILFLLIMLQANAIFSQGIDNKKLCRTWMTKNSFSDSSLYFRSIEPADSATIYRTYQFKPNGEIIFNYNVPKSIGVCGNGTPYVIKAAWKIKSNQIGYLLNIYIKGGAVRSNADYEYNRDYEISELTESKMILKLVRTSEKNSNNMAAIKWVKYTDTIQTSPIIYISFLYPDNLAAASTGDGVCVGEKIENQGNNDITNTMNLYI